MDNVRFGMFISEIRKEVELTQKELAEILVVSDKAVSKWERGLCYPDITLLPKLCNVLDVTMIELFSCEKGTSDITSEKVEDVMKKSLMYSGEVIGTSRKRFRRHTKILITVFVLLLLGVCTTMFDYFRYLNYQDPIFVFSRRRYESIEEHSNILTEYYGFGYKINKYEYVNGKNVYEFGHYLMDVEITSITDSEVQAIEKILTNNIDKDIELYSSIQVLSVENTEDGKMVYLMHMSLSEYVEEGAGIRLPVKIPYRVTIRNREIPEYVFESPRDAFLTSCTEESCVFDYGNYERIANEIFPENVRIIIENFYVTKFYEDFLNKLGNISADKQIIGISHS